MPCQPPADQSAADCTRSVSVIVRLPRPVDNPEPSKYYARWNGGYVEARICAILAILAPVAKGSDAITQQLRWLYTALLLINHVSPQVTDMLIAQWICPADLRGEPCKHDKLAGCQKIRLCRVSELLHHHLLPPFRPVLCVLRPPFDVIEGSCIPALTASAATDAGKVHDIYVLLCTHMSTYPFGD